MRKHLLLFLCLIFFSAASFLSRDYPWLENYDRKNSICSTIMPPQGYERYYVPEGSFAWWLRYLPVKTGVSTVFLYDGTPKRSQNAHYAIIDIDQGTRDLQQCADAVIRLISEYLYSVKAYEHISFRFTSGHVADYIRWRKGYRPKVSGSAVKWEQNAAEDTGYDSFRRYLDTVFTYAGTYSLQKELETVESINEMQAGDIFIQGGFPGHAVIVVDMARNNETGKAVFLLAQSYMPAQDMHILKNPSQMSISPWYDLDFGDSLATPEWTFSRNDLKRYIFRTDQ